MRKKTLVKHKTVKDAENPKWQTGEYERHTKLDFILPDPFLLLCKLTDITPETILSDFMDNLACGSWKRQGRDKAKEYLIQYFLEMNYGQELYTAEDLRQMFKEMDAVGLLWPEKGKMKLIDLYAQWRDKYEKFWFKKWFRKPRRKF
jgi:hypothetical protein